MKIGIVVSEFNAELTTQMLEYALKKCQELNLDAQTSKVAGAFDMPLAVKRLLKRKDIRGVATLGAIIQGETDHDIIIASSCATALTGLSLEFDKPVSLGILGPRITWQQAKARMKDYAERAVESLLRIQKR